MYEPKQEPSLRTRSGSRIVTAVVPPEESNSRFVSSQQQEAQDPGSTKKMNTSENSNTAVSSPYKSMSNSNSEEESVHDETAPSLRESNDGLNKQPSFSGATNEAFRFFIPNFERIKWTTFILLTLMVAIPVTIYIFFFTRIGYGTKAFYYLSDHFEQYAGVLGGAIVAFFVVLYLLDFTSWDSKHGAVARDICCVILMLGVCLLFLFMSGEHPYGPICLFIVLTPLWLLGMKVIFYPRKDTRVFVSWLSGPLLFASVVTLIMWMAWSFAADDHEWNEITEWHAAEEVGCEPNLEDYPECQKQDDPTDVCFTISLEDNKIYFDEGCAETCPDSVFEKCTNTFILWVGPLMVSLGLFFLSFFCTFVREDSVEKDIVNFGKLWVILLFSMWVVASLSGVSAGVTSAIIAMTLAGFVASAVFLIFIYSRAEIKSHKKEFKKRMEEKYGAYFDIVRGLLVVTCLPIAIIYIILSFLNQCVRRTGIFRCSKSPEVNNDDPDAERKTTWLTARTSEQINQFKSWDRSKVYTYAIYWGIAFMTMNVVVAQFTLLFLSWLIDATSSMGLGVVTVILVAVGLIMFLLPPVPGVPIYLTMGIVILAIGQETLGLVGAMAYCCAVSLILKLFACACQQKLIGEQLAGSVKVRSFVGINTKLIRSMKLVLKEPGLGISKCAILIGGPDWPTSVLCGIMKLRLIPILVGTIPVIFLIIPTVLTGSFTYMAGVKEDGKSKYPWAGTMAAIFAAFTACVQFGAMVVAAYYVERTASTRGAELDEMPIDEEVQVLEERSKQREKVYRDVTKWGVMPVWVKTVLNLATWCMVTSCYMVQLFYKDCFADYTLTSTIDEDLDGDWTNLVKPLGRYALLIFCISLFFFQIFYIWSTRKAKQAIDGGVISPENHPPTVRDLEST
mmetsp:Transcript_5005/g.6896  ORF Transcript_5005/g.6896 Transcript_5005/m.6896 type:complete len:903 (-) Transcript_5005:383-3091(-)